MKNRLVKLISAFLSFLMVFQIAEPALASLAEEEPDVSSAAAAWEPYADELVLRDSEGNETVVDETWEEAYPFGAFAFGMTGGSVREGEDTVITLYRAGGTHGRATAYIEYMPVAVSNEDGSIYLGYGLSGRDIVIEVEDPLPVSEYQAVGKYDDPEPGDAFLLIDTDDEGYVLSLSEEAEEYLWQVLNGGVWTDIIGSDAIDLKTDAEYLDEYDFRCVYTKDGARFCTASLKGVAYEKPEQTEFTADPPEGIELNPETTFSVLPIDDEDDPYSGWMFSVTFADGEWKKEIRLHANTDDEAEALEEGATFRIADTDGGEICLGAETYMFTVEDINESTPSSVGFTVQQTDADKADGRVVLTVRREGGSERPVSVTYATHDGAAAAGRDYAAAAGTLLFYGNVTEQKIEVELIDDRIADDEAREFSVTIAELKGDDNCVMGTDSVTVRLTNSGTGTAENPASVFYDPEAVDMTASVAESPTSASPAGQAAVGGQVTLEVPEPVEMTLLSGVGGEMSTQVHDFGNDPLANYGTINFADAAVELGNKAWTDTEELAVASKWKLLNNGSEGGTSLYAKGDTISGGYGYMRNPDGDYYADWAYGNNYKVKNGLAVAGVGSGDAKLKEEYEKTLGQMYSAYHASYNMYYSHSRSTYVASEGKCYGAWTAPKLVIGSLQTNNGKNSGDILNKPTEPDGTRAVGFINAQYAKNWEVEGKGSDGKWSMNPHHNYQGSINTTGPVGVTIDVSFTSTRISGKKKEQCHKTLINLSSLEMTRRYFREDAFSVDIATANDANTGASAGAAEISKYDAYLPAVSLKEGGVHKNGSALINSAFVGSTVIVTPKEVPGLSVEDILVLYTEEKPTVDTEWKAFDKFSISDSGSGKQITLLNKSGTNPLTRDEISNYYFRFRVVYTRTNKITVDLSPSLPRDDAGNQLTDSEAVAMLFNNYTPNGSSQAQEDHCFALTADGEDVSITVGYSKYDSALMDYKSTITKKPETVYQKKYASLFDEVFTPDRYEKVYPAEPKFTLSITSNIQWICFGLDKRDLLLFNGRGYSGDAKIWLTEEDLAGDITVLYYHQNYQGYINPMTTAVSWKALYLDGNGDGAVTGTFENGLFTLTDPEDAFIKYLSDGDSINEMELEPIEYEPGKFAQYYILLCYTMTPRCLEPVKGEEDYLAQVLPAFTTAIDKGSSAYAEQTPEQKKYTYVESGGISEDIKHTSDNHPMFRAEANQKTLLAIPLGGDKSPAHLNEDNSGYDWTPNWFENYLVPFEHPDLITIANSLAGPTAAAEGKAKTKPTVKGTVIEYEYDRDALRQINGYLASFNGTTTFLLVSAIQKTTTEEYVEARDKNDSGTPLAPPVSDSDTFGCVYTVPDASYLKVMRDTEAPEFEMSSTGSSKDKGAFPELAQTFFTAFGSNEIGVTNWVTIIAEENLVGFCISVPLASGETDPNSNNKWGWKDFFVGPNGDYLESLGKLGDRDHHLGDETLQKTWAKKNGTSTTTPTTPAGPGGGGGGTHVPVQGTPTQTQSNPRQPAPSSRSSSVPAPSTALTAQDASSAANNTTNPTTNPTTTPAANNAAPASTSKRVSTKKFSVQLSVQSCFIWEYDPLNNGYHFVNWGIGIAGELEFRMEARFTPCPPLYIYLDVKFSVEIMTGVKVAQTVSFDTDLLSKTTAASHGSTANYSEEVEPITLNYSDDGADRADFEMSTKAFDITFAGKLYVQVLAYDGKSYTAEKADERGYVSGTISSNGKEPVRVVITNTYKAIESEQRDMTLQEPVMIRLYAMQTDEGKTVNETTISSIKPIKKLESEARWAGLKLSPKLGIEVGVGVGVELLKAEIFLHVSIGGEFMMFSKNDAFYENIAGTDKYLPPYTESFEFEAGIAVRVVLAILSYELDLISYKITYEHVPDGNGVWKHGIYYVNGMADPDEWIISEDTDDPDYGVTARLPRNMADSQTVYSPADNAADELTAQAYDFDDPSIPFQVSGYNPSTDAVNLTESIPEGSSCKVIRVREQNFLIYALSRGGTEPEDSTMLVMSKLAFDEEHHAYGLMNPAGHGQTQYIVLDNETDPTGDLDFDVWAEETADDSFRIHAAWVSYASLNPGDVTRPDGEPYSDEINGTIGADNYERFAAVEEADAWYDYYRAMISPNAMIEVRAKRAAENTVVKTASWSEGDSAFSDPVVISDNASTHYVFQPASADDGKVVFYASTFRKDDGSLYAAYSAYQDAKHSESQDVKITNYLKAVRRSTLDVTGSCSALNLAVQNENGTWKTATAVLPEGQTLDNVEFTRGVNGGWYVAYTTEQTTYRDSDMITAYRLYLRAVTEENGEFKWSLPVLIRELRDYDRGTGADGAYSRGLCTSEYDDPYFADLTFLTANVDADILTGGEPLSELEIQDVEEQLLLIFEMNGTTYVIPEKMLALITSGGEGGLIYPFFTPALHENADGELVPEGAAGKMKTSICADNKNNLYAVYIGNVSGTTSNALYISTYDPWTNSWSSGVMLAMHDMNTYETAIRSKWDDVTTEAAYLYGLGTDSLTKLYDSEVVNTFEELDASERDRNLGDAKTFTFSDLQTVVGDTGELLVITGGSAKEMTVSTYKEDGETKYVLMPKCDEETKGIKTVSGTYAISFGEGQQALGNGAIYFGSKNFKADKQIYVAIEAENTGTTAFRGNGDYPITAILSLDGQELACWEVGENIASGQAMRFEGFTVPLAHNLVTNDKFVLSLVENADYANQFNRGPVRCDLVLFTVESRPDLGVHELSIERNSVSDDGTETTFDVSFVATNQGSADTGGVYVQFSYAVGTDEAGDPVYVPLDISKNDLKVGPEQQLSELLSTQESETDLKNGILRLNSTDHLGNYSGNLAAGYGKRVSGTITVSKDVFAAGESGHAQIQVEIFSGGDSMTVLNGGQVTVRSGEYYTADNAVNQRVEAFTEFTAAHRIVIPLGSTTKLALTAISSRGTKPVITAEEIDDKDGLNIGILNFKQSAADNGALRGILSITPIEIGTGVIHVADTATNSVCSIAFEVVDASEGIDIYRDNAAFTFYNFDKPTEVFDEKGIPAKQSWSFLGATSWGTYIEENVNGETIDTVEMPMRGNLSTGDENAFFTFDSAARSIDLFFTGTIEVSSTNPEFESPAVFTNIYGGSAFTNIFLGENPDSIPYRITVKILSAAATFDRLVEHFTDDVVPLPEYDGTSPVFIWSRSFPDTASVRSKTRIPLKVYVLDNNGIGNLTITKGKTQEQITDPDVSPDVTVLDGDGLVWCYDFGEISENCAANQPYVLTATDISGNTVTDTLLIDWFLDVPTGDTNTVSVPEYTPYFELNGRAVGNERLGTANGLGIDFFENVSNAKSRNNTHEVYFFTGEAFDPVGADADGMFPVAENGLYVAQTLNADGTWSAAVLCMDLLDASLPQVRCSYDAETGCLNWKAFKKDSSGLDIISVTVNDCEVNAGEGTSLSGSFPAAFNGVYTIVATDTDGRTGSLKKAVTEAALQVKPSAETVFIENPGGGAVMFETALSAVITGGPYDEDSDTANGEYKAVYQTALIRLNAADEVPSAEDAEWTGKTEATASQPGSMATTVWKPGFYVIAARAGDETVFSDLITVTFSEDTTDPVCGIDGKTVCTVTVTVGREKYENSCEKILPMLVHDWGDPTYYWEEDASMVTASRTCAHDKTHVEMETADTTAAAATDPDCENAGTVTYTAVFQNAVFETQTKTVEDRAALGHDWNEPAYTWSEDNGTVTAVRICRRDETHIETETVSTAAETTDPVCTEGGTVTYTASFRNGGFETQKKTVESTKALGHAWGLPVYTWSEDNAAVTAVRICANDETHTEEETVGTVSEATPPDCENAGTVTYTAVFANAAFEKQTKTVESTEARGHAWGQPTYAWTKDKSKVTAKAVCRNDPSHTAEETVRTEYEIITEATPEKEGLGRYTASFENKLFEDQTMDVVIPPTEHIYGEPEFVWTDDGHVTVTFPAEGDSVKNVTLTDEDGSVTVKKKTAKPTCEEDGKTVYTAEVFFRGKTYTDACEKILPASGHDWGKPVFVWSADKTSAKASVTCLNDPSHVREFTAAVHTDYSSALGISTVIRTATVVIDGKAYRDIIPEVSVIRIPKLPVPVKETEPKEDAPSESGTEEPALPFVDVKPEDPFYDDVKYVYDKGIMNGVSATEFDPASDLSRGMIVTVLYRMEGEPEVPEISAFTDVPVGTWYSDGVTWAASKGIVNGYGDGTYGPGHPVTREQLAAILFRYAEYREYDVESEAIDASDAESISGWAAENVIWAVSNGILEAENGRIRPTEPASRAEIAGAIHVFLETVAE